MASSDAGPWPELPAAAWRDTRETLRLWTQIVGKITARADAVAQPFLACRALRDGARPHHVADSLWRPRIRDRIRLRRPRAFGADERGERSPPAARADAGRAILLGLMTAMAELGLNVRITTTPCEIADPIPFDQDRIHAAYDREYAHRFWRILLSAHDVLAHFRTGFLGKASPVHFFWGSFDLAVTRFSGRRAPLHPGGVPHLPTPSRGKPIRTRSRAPASGPAGAVRSTKRRSIPTPTRPRRALRALPCCRPRPCFSKDLGEFILPYEAVYRSPAPRRMLMDFLQATYDAAADLGRWDRAALECPLGEPGRPRPMS